MKNNLQLTLRLMTVCVGMFAFGYMLIPLYKAFCTWTGVNVLALSEREARGSINGQAAMPVNTQIDATRLITVEFDTNVRGPWKFTPETHFTKVHPGELTTVMFEFENVQDRTMSVQAIPSYAPQQAGGHFNKIECFCFKQHTLAPGEKKAWPVVFYIHPKLPREVNTITLSYTFFEVGAGT